MALGLVVLGGLGGCALVSPLRGSAGTGDAGGAGGDAVTAAAAGRDLGPGSSRSPNEVPSPAPPLEHGTGAPDPAVALRRFATDYINWDAAGVSADLRRLAGTAVGQARSVVELQAAQVGADPALAREGIDNHGTVESVAPAAGAAGRWIVVTLEQSGATRSTAYAGVGPAWHVALAGVSRRREGWVVSYWQIES